MQFFLLTGVTIGMSQTSYDDMSEMAYPFFDLRSYAKKAASHGQLLLSFVTKLHVVVYFYNVITS